MEEDDILILLSDNIRVQPITSTTVKLSKDEIDKIRKLKLKKHAEENHNAIIYDKDKYDLHNAMQRTANSFILNPQQTNIDARTPEGLAKIESLFDLALNNADIVMATIPTGNLFRFKALANPSKIRKTIGVIETFNPFKIGLGAEAVVVKNSPTYVLKIMGNATPKEMIEKSSVPYSLPYRFAGYVKDGSRRLGAYILKKADILKGKDFIKGSKELDNKYLRLGYDVKNEGVLGSTYIDKNKQYVITDLGEGNIARESFNIFDPSTWFKRDVVIVDPIKLPYSDYMSMFEKGGKFIPKHLSGGKSSKLPKLKTINFLYDIENPRGVGIKGDWAVAYNDGNWTIGPGVTSSVKDSEPWWFKNDGKRAINRVPKVDVDNAAYNHISNDDARVRNSYDLRFGTERFPHPSDTLSILPRLIVAQHRYLRGSVAGGNLKGIDEINSALAKGNINNLITVVSKWKPLGDEDRERRLKVAVENYKTK